MELPYVTLEAPPLCPGTRHAPPRGDGPAYPWTDAEPPRTDARTDGPVDGPVDAETDGPRGVLAVIPDVSLPQPGAARLAWLTAAHWAARLWQSACSAATNPRGPWDASPESLAAHDAYRRSRAWVPPGHEGKFLGPAGDAYHHTLARFGMAAGYALAWVFARPLRLVITAAVTGGIALGFWLG